MKTPLFVGSHTEYVIGLGDDALRLWSPRADLVAAGSPAWVSVDGEDFLVRPVDTTQSPAAAPSVATPALVASS